MPLVPRTGPAQLAVIVPLYNEARVLEFFAGRLTAVLDELDLSWSILFVSDGSTDATVPPRRARGAPPRHFLPSASPATSVTRPR